MIPFGMLNLPVLDQWLVLPNDGKLWTPIYPPRCKKLNLNGWPRSILYISLAVRKYFRLHLELNVRSWSLPQTSMRKLQTTARNAEPFYTIALPIVEFYKFGSDQPKVLTWSCHRFIAICTTALKVSMLENEQNEKKIALGISTVDKTTGKMCTKG